MSSYHKPTDELTENGENEPSCSKQTASLVSVISEDGNNSSTKGTVRTIFVIDLRNIDNKTKVNSSKDLGDGLQKMITQEISKHNIPLRGPLEKSYSCPICKQTFSYIKLLNEHMLTEHKGIKGYKCNICRRSYVLREYLLNHQALHKKDRLLKCGFCAETFTRRFHLTNHKRAKHLHGPAICEYCGKHFKKYTGLNTHLYIHHSKNNSCVCDVCGKSFISNGYLTCHKLIHSNQNIACDICKKTYPHKRALNKHIYYVHTEKKKHSCTICDKEFKHQFSLRIHVQLKHKVGEKPKCHICNATLSTRTALNTHMKMIHIGLTPHACKHCKQEFRWKPTCKKHEQKCLEKQMVKEVGSRSQLD